MSEVGTELPIRDVRSSAAVRGKADNIAHMVLAKAPSTYGNAKKVQQLVKIGSIGPEIDQGEERAQCHLRPSRLHRIFVAGVTDGSRNTCYRAAR